MKELIIISSGRATSKSLYTQLNKIYGEYTEIRSFSLEDEIVIDLNNSLLVLSSNGIDTDSRVKNFIEKGVEYVIARRVINHSRISELLNLPEETDVLLINDCKDSTYIAISQLQALGISYIIYHPYYPSMSSYPKTDIAVTVGEPSLVPPEFSEVIDIGTRQIDMITLSDIAKRLGIIESLGDNLYTYYLQDIIKLLYKINVGAKELKKTSNRLQTVANCMTKAIIYVNNSGTIILSNQAMHNLLNCSSEDIIGENLSDIIPELSINSNSFGIMNIHNKELLVTSNPINDVDTDKGTIFTFEKSEEIEKNEYEIRKKTSKDIMTSFYTFKDILYGSKRMGNLINKAKSFAQTDSTILIQGESGTGKELFAQAIHSVSTRADGPFVPVNITAIPESLIESELFGYEEGSFTGAIKGGKRGLFEEAHGGTIFIDEIGDAPQKFQCSLLRVIQERKVRRVGGYKEIPIDVRIIAATNRSLLEEIRNGKFRSDLYYRLNVLPILMLSLRERKFDINVLADFFLNKYSGGMINKMSEILEEESIEAIFKYDWPGNIRELENAMEYLACIWSGGRKLRITDIPEYIINDYNKNQNYIIEDVLGEDMIWLLRKLANSDGLGRRNLAELAKIEGFALSEGQIRTVLNNAQSLGFVSFNAGRKGTTLTEKGYLVFNQTCRNGICGS